jgi:hypothetical protein
MIKHRGKAVQIAVMIAVALTYSQSLAEDVLPDRACQSMQSSDQKRKADLTLKVIDKATRRPLANKAIEIHSDNGIRCIKAPCPTDAMTWDGTTDERGYVLVPGEKRRTSMNIRAVGYGRGADLTKDSIKRNKNCWVIALKPDQPGR